MNGLYINENTFLSFAEIQRYGLTKEIATRANSAQFFGTLWGALPDPDLVLQKLGINVTAYKPVMLDPHVYSCMEQRKAKTLSMEWEINRGGSRSRNIKFIENLFHDADFNISNIMDSMLNAIAYGMQPMEVMWEKIGQYWVPVTVKEKPVEWFVFDDENRPRFLSKNSMVDGELLPYRRFLIAQHKATYQNPYGERVLARCYWPAIFKRSTEKWWIEFLEKYGALFAVGKLPRSLMSPGSKEQSELLTILDMLVNSAVAVLPDDGSVDFKESNTKTQTSESYIMRCNYSNSEISKAILTQTLTTEISDKGSFAAAETHSDMLTHLALKDRLIIESELNLLIKWIYEVNFSDPNPPKITLFIPEDVDKELADRDKILVDCGARFTRQYFIDTYNMDEKYLQEEEPAPADKGTPPAEPGKIKDPEKDNKATAGDGEFEENPLSATADTSFRKGGLLNKLVSFLAGKKKDKSEKPSVDILTASVPDEVLQQYMDTMLKPVFDLINSGSSMEDVNKKLAELFPDMDSTGLEQLLAKMFFISEVYGRLSAAEQV
jgi:phage gp29-like protein